MPIQVNSHICEFWNGFWTTSLHQYLSLSKVNPHHKTPVPSPPTVALVYNFKNVSISFTHQLNSTNQRFLSERLKSWRYWDSLNCKNRRPNHRSCSEAHFCQTWTRRQARLQATEPMQTSNLFLFFDLLLQCISCVLVCKNEHFVCTTRFSCFRHCMFRSRNKSTTFLL